MTLINVLFSTLLALGLIGDIAFLVAYTRHTRWWRSEVGMNLASFAIAFGLVEAVTLFRYLLRGVWPWTIWVLLGLTAVVVGVIWWRFWIMARSFRSRKATTPGS